jgi:ribonuclease BN (tRNA processing enzyme)
VSIVKIQSAGLTSMFVMLAAALSAAPAQIAVPSKTQVVFLGTGAPPANPDRSGPATAIVVNGVAYLVDLGPGVVRRANAAAIAKRIEALEPTRLRVAFITHLHSDHTVGYPDLIFTPWSLGRREPIDVYGPRGIKSMTEHLIEAYRVDIETRGNPNGLERDYPDGYKVNAHEITTGVIYRDSNVTVTAFPTKHAMESYGYRFDTGDRSIVISGDTSPTQATIDACNGCDVLIHESHAQPFLATRSAVSKEFGEKYHTNPAQMADVARAAKPRLLLIYHLGGSAAVDGLFDDIRSRYSGLFAIARDLDVF